MKLDKSNLKVGFREKEILLVVGDRPYVLDVLFAMQFADTILNAALVADPLVANQFARDVNADAEAHGGIYIPEGSVKQ